ncbi:PREDICTED: tetraspanin-3-like [Chaetura pelagica]|uniref:tetraspanin-3-like n=1 Tax=Chaetura pelagica TaxID=8897 RepID=UPI000523DB46|nr:PREDICTED: tetraspanin-3-like [Chaetura pelagica]
MWPSSLWCYEYSWLRPFAQSLLRILGFIFCGTAAALAFGGVLVILMYKNYSYLLQESFLSVPGWLAVAAALTLLPTGVLSISLSAKSSRCQQGTLMYLLLVLLCLEISSGVMAHLYSIRMPSELKSTLDHLVSQYNGTRSQAPDSRVVDMVQTKLQCCGVQNYTDWLKATAASWHFPAEKSRVPESCCKEKYSRCGSDLSHVEWLFQEGCLKKLEDRLCFVTLYVFWCCILLSVLELLAGASNGMLMIMPSWNFQILDSSTFSKA